VKKEETIPGLGKEFKLAVLLFILFGILFAFASSQLGHVYDLAGLSGKKPQVADGKTEIKPTGGNRTPAKANPKPSEFSTQDPWGQPLEVIPAAKPLTIDGLITEWTMTRGIFMTPNYKNQANTSSVWFHFMYDQQYLYVLVRCRGWDMFVDDASTSEEIGRDYCLQIQIEGEEPLAFTYLGTVRGKAYLERRSYAKKKKKDESAVSDAVASGAAIAITRQPTELRSTAR
jgi:hypothetical protein